MKSDAELTAPQTKSGATGRMKALVYHGPGSRAWEEVPRPGIQHATDAVVRITISTICGTDLHILKGDLPRFALDDVMKAYDTFGNAAKEGALKVILKNPV